jgi:hypothetical protein
MAYVGNTPSKVPLTSADITDSIITSAKITDGTIVNADIANSTINLTTKVTGSLPVANGGTGLTALGTASQVLRTNSGATALEFATLTSDYVLLASTDASASASISFDGYFSSTYRNYKLILSSVYNATNNVGLYVKVRVANADVSTGYYSINGVSYFDSGAGSVSNVYSSGANTTYAKTLSEITSDVTRPFSAEFTMYNPLSTTTEKMLNYNATYWGNATVYISNCFGSFIRTGSNSALSGITFYMSSGNITSGNFKLYGIK